MRIFLQTADKKIKLVRLKSFWNCIVTKNVCWMVELFINGDFLEPVIFSVYNTHNSTLMLLHVNNKLREHYNINAKFKRCRLDVKYHQIFSVQALLTIL